MPRESNSEAQGSLHHKCYGLYSQYVQYTYPIQSQRKKIVDQKLTTTYGSAENGKGPEVLLEDLRTQDCQEFLRLVVTSEGLRFLQLRYAESDKAQEEKEKTPGTLLNEV